MRGFTLKASFAIVLILAAIAFVLGPQIYSCSSRRPTLEDLARWKCHDLHILVTVWMGLTESPRHPPALACIETPILGDDAPYAVVDPDPWGQPYRLVREGPRAFRICSNGPDAIPDTADDIAYPPAASE